uniref:Retrovirus-related Pol polyprotein from transposon TNT 1-94 n=1 Tax=Tanacetum cinerariifolium TaxID=118510 RepID=A0A6L2JNQ0_TANCI|nr:retrovirus-related Pol polyprotein from transposon TNT 1-94 [Tanacetum cinerariifolium]
MAAGSRDLPLTLATGRYPQWRSRFLRYIDTRTNGEALRKCILSGPYKPTTVLVQAVEATADSPAIPEHTTVETPMNMTPENKAYFEEEKEAIHLILTGIGDKIYSTQQHKLDEVSYHKLFDILKQYQNEVNELRAERLARNANPLALVATAQANQDLYYQTSRSHKSHAPSSKPLIPTRSHTTTRHKGKEIAKPIIPPSKIASEEDNDPEQAQRDKDMQKNLTLIAKYFKKIYKPTNNNLRTSSNSKNKNVDTTPRFKNDNQSGQFRNQKTVNVAGARENVGSLVVQQFGIQCFNYKEFGHFAKECRKPKRVKDFTYHKEKMLLYKQAEQETSNVIPDSPDMCEDDIQNEQNDVESDDEHVALSNLIANLKLNVHENKKIQKQLKKANTTLVQELKECKTILAETSKSLGESISVRDSCIVALQTKQVEFEKYKAFNDRTIDYDKLEQIIDNAWIKHLKYQFRALTAQDMEILIHTCLMPLASKTQNDSFRFVHELKQEMHANLNYVESLEKEIDELESNNAKFSDMYDVILQECVSNDVKCSYLQSLSDLDALAELQCLYLHKVKECDCLTQKLSKQTESVSKKVHNELLQSFSKVEKHSISLEITLQKFKEQVKNDTICNEKASNVFRKEREQYIKIQDLKAQLQDKNIVIGELKKLIEKGKGKCEDTKFDKPSVVQQPNAQRIPKPSVLGNPAPFSNSLKRIYFLKTKSIPKANVSECLSKPVTAQTLPQTAGKAIVQLIIFIVDFGCTKHMTSNLKLLCNFVEKFLGTVLFGNDQFVLILGYGDLVQGNVTINRVYYVKGLNHNLFLVGQFWDANLEVTFRKSTCFVRDLQGNDLLTGNRGSDLYTISLQETTSSTLLCLMAKSSPTQAWLWHQRLSHLNFDYINLLSKKDTVIGLPKLKYVKDQLCSSCELSKAKRSSFKSKAVLSSKGRLNLLHIDLCGPMRVASINGKKYILVIVDDYSRYTWTLFLRSKDETPEVLKEFLTMIQKSSSPSDYYKMKEKRDSFILVGYSTQSKGYHVYNKRTRMIVESIHIRFDEIKEVSETSVANNTSGLVPQRQKASDYDNSDPENTDDQPEGEHAPDDEFTNPFCTPIQEVAESSSHNIAMQEELHQFNRLQVWEHVEKPFGKTVIKLKWLWKNKKDEDQTVIHNKARLVAKGYAQEEGQSIGTPMATKPKLDADLSGNPVDQNDYRSKIGSLVYLTSSRPDIVTEYQLADMFTKALPEDRFKYLVRRIGMRCLTPAELEVLAK